MTTIPKERKLLMQALDALETCAGAPCVDRAKKAVREYLAAPATTPEQPRPFIPWSKEAEMLESWAAQPATAPAQPAWHDAPTCEGMWVNMMSGRLIVITEETLEAWQNAAVRWYGPIPEDSQ